MRPRRPGRAIWFGSSTWAFRRLARLAWLERGLCPGLLTWIIPHLPIGEYVRPIHPRSPQAVGLLDGSVCVQVIPSISGVYDDRMGVCQTQTQENDDGGPPRYRPMEFHDGDVEGG